MWDTLNTNTPPSERARRNRPVGDKWAEAMRLDATKHMTASQKKAGGFEIQKDYSKHSPNLAPRRSIAAVQYPLTSQQQSQLSNRSPGHAPPVPPTMTRSATATQAAGVQRVSSAPPGVTGAQRVSQPPQAVASATRITSAPRRSSISEQGDAAIDRIANKYAAAGTAAAAMDPLAMAKALQARRKSSKSRPRQTLPRTDVAPQQPVRQSSVNPGAMPAVGAVPPTPAEKPRYSSSPRPEDPWANIQDQSPAQQDSPAPTHKTGVSEQMT